MINKDQIMLLLCEACPSFITILDAHRAEYEEELVYLELAEFSSHLMYLHYNGQTQDFGAIFDVVELLHLEGDHYVKEAATIGFLESLQNNVDSEGLNPNTFVEYLRPESLFWWGRLNDFWVGKAPYVYDNRSEKD